MSLVKNPSNLSILAERQIRQGQSVLSRSHGVRRRVLSGAGLEAILEYDRLHRRQIQNAVTLRSKWKSVPR